jgi:hypothetical protein
VSHRTDHAIHDGARCNFDKEIAMKRTARLLSMIAGIAIAAPAAAPFAVAGEIVKCVDSSGHVTLTDQPCDSGALSVRLEQGMEPGAMPQRHVLPAADLRHEAWKRPAVARPAPLSRDVATLKAARRSLLLQDARPALAGLN